MQNESMQEKFLNLGLNVEEFSSSVASTFCNRGNAYKKFGEEQNLNEDDMMLVRISSVFPKFNTFKCVTNSNYSAKQDVLYGAVKEKRRFPAFEKRRIRRKIDVKNTPNLC